MLLSPVAFDILQLKIASIVEIIRFDSDPKETRTIYMTDHNVGLKSLVLLNLTEELARLSIFYRPAFSVASRYIQISRFSYNFIGESFFLDLYQLVEIISLDFLNIELNIHHIFFVIWLSFILYEFKEDMTFFG